MEEKLTFTDRQDFRKWLEKNHGINKGIWIVFSKTEALQSVNADEALEEALCFGWIDGQILSIDEAQYQKKFTPRRNGSHWSEKNKKLATMLIDNGRMTEFGVMAIEKAKKSGRWDAVKDEKITDEQVNDLIAALQGSELALTNFLKMSPSVKKTYTALYLDAKKEETRIRRLNKIIERLNENKKPM
ncbi:YdeI/OmpD-associated family protein [Fusibacter bizertensis]